MDKIVYNVKLDLLNDLIQGSVKGLKMGEHDARQFRISLRQNLKAVNLTGEETAVMYVRKTGVENPSIQACTIEGNEVVYNVNASDVDTEGEVLFTLKIQLNGAITFTPHFCGYVMNPDVSDAEVPSQVEYTALEALITEVEGIKDDWGEALEDLQEIIERGGWTTVVANPTLDGTEPELNGIEIDGNKYKIPEGGSGGVSDYNDLLNLPYINGVQVKGAKSLSQYGIEPKTYICESQQEYDNMVHDPDTRYLVPVDDDDEHEVEANPTLDGTEDTLNGIRIGDTKYKIEGGGGGGVTPVITASASVDSNTGTPSVAVSKSGTDAAPSFAFAFHNLKGANGADGQNGQNGADGADGADGFSPTVNVTSITGGHRVTITDAEGPHQFDVMDGEDGEGGGEGTTVVANPALVGTEAELTGLQVGNTKYKVPSGGGVHITTVDNVKHISFTSSDSNLEELDEVLDEYY